MASPPLLTAQACDVTASRHAWRKRGSQATAATLLVLLIAANQEAGAQAPASLRNDTQAGLIAARLVAAFTTAVGQELPSQEPGGLPPTATNHSLSQDGMLSTGSKGRLDLAQLMRNITQLKAALLHLGVALQDMAPGEAGGSSSPSEAEPLDLPLEQWQALRQALVLLEVLPQQDAVGDVWGRGGAGGEGSSGSEEGAEEEAARSARGLLTNTPTAPVGSGDNLAAFRKRVRQVKQLYKDARTYLYIDDAVRLGGHINRLESLAIRYTSAYPISETAFFTANLKLVTDLTGLVFRVLRVARGFVDLAARIILLDVALEAARRRKAAEAAAAAAPRAASSSSASPGADGSSSGSSAPQPGATVQELLGIPAASPQARSSGGSGGGGSVRQRNALNGQVDSSRLLNDVVAVSQQLTDQLVPWIVGGGLTQPLNIAQAALRLTLDSLSRLQAWQPTGADIMDQAMVSSLLRL